jgi:acetyl esterase
MGRLANVARGNGALPSVAESRASMAQTAAMFDRPAPPLARIEDIGVAGADGMLRARLFSDTPAGGGLRPAMVYYHGGGFVQGDLDTHHHVCAKIAKWWGGIVIAVDYRLAPEHPFPAGPDDAIAAFRFVRDNGASLGVDGARTGVGGDSAGGCLAAVVAQQVTEKPAFQVLIYPVTDGRVNSPSVNDLVNAYILPKARMVWYRDQYAGAFRDFDDPKFSPLLAADFSGLPPAFVVTGGFDPLQDDGLEYSARMEAAGGTVLHRHFEGQVHAFFNLTRVIPEATTALEEVALWLRGLWP